MISCVKKATHVPSRIENPETSGERATRVSAFEPSDLTGTSLDKAGSIHPLKRVGIIKWGYGRADKTLALNNDVNAISKMESRIWPLVKTEFPPRELGSFYFQKETRILRTNL